MYRRLVWPQADVTVFHFWEKQQHESGELGSCISQGFSTTGKKTGKRSKKCQRREKKNPKSKPYDKAYFFIFFVMLVYSFLALTVLLGYSCSKKAISKKDLYQEFNESEPWNKNVTHRWWRSITLKTKSLLWTLKSGYCAKYS